jgi:hypothetical protein
MNLNRNSRTNAGSIPPEVHSKGAALEFHASAEAPRSEAQFGAVRAWEIAATLTISDCNVPSVDTTKGCS